jgi:hypothetical protein
VIVVDYNPYLKAQNDWARSLTKQAKFAPSEIASEMAIRAGQALKRLVAMSRRPTLNIASTNRRR